jgi:alpha-tubulin suppressor-like RCC1 family protein
MNKRLNLKLYIYPLLSLASFFALKCNVRAAAELVAWGDNQAGQTSVPNELTGVKSFDAGNEHVLALKNDGTLVAWGSNWAGQTNIPNGLTDIKSVVAGGHHCVVLRNNGTLAAWGYNNDGQTNIPSQLGFVSDIAAGNERTLALKADETVAAWGNPSWNQTQVPAGLSGVKKITAGGEGFNIALKTDGTLVIWGYNGHGQASPPAGLNNINVISAGLFHIVALKNDGTVVAWGENSYGQCDVPNGLQNVIAVSAGAHHTVALKSDGTVIAWGRNQYGQINVPAGLNKVTAISAGGNFTVAQVSLNEPPTITAPSAQIIIQDTNTNVLSFIVNDLESAADSLTVSGISSNTSLVPNSNISIGGSGSNRTVRVTPAAGQTGTATITLNVSDGTAIRTASFQLTVLPTKPLFTLNPEGEKAVNPNSPATFTATYVAGIQPFTYRWRKNGTTISGATASSYTISNAQQTHEGSYDCVITNSYGSFTTPATALTVNDPVVFLSPPLSQAANVDQEVNLSFQYTGTEPVEFQWRKNGTPLPGENAPNLIFIADADSGGYYDVIATNSVGSVTSSSATLTVLVPPAITAQPSDQNVSAGATAFFSVTASGPGLTYQWRRNGTDLSKQNGPMLMVSNVQKSNEGVYDVLVKNSFGAVLSEPAWLTLPTPLSITEQPLDVTAALGDTASFSVTATGQGTLSYQWLKDGKPIKGATASTLDVVASDPSAAAAYAVIVSSGTLKVTSFPAFLKIAEQGLLIYKFTLTGNSYEGTASSKIALSGLLVLDRLNQRGGIIRFAKNGKLDTFTSSVDEGLHTHSTGPVTNSQTVVTKVVQEAASPDEETTMFWLRGTDGLVTLSNTDKTMAPKTLAGFQTELSLTGYTEVTSLTLAATLDNAASLQARQAGETVEQTLNRLSAGLQQKGFIRE